MCIVGGRETEDRNEREEIKTKGTHLGKFCQGVLRANMITQPQTQEDRSVENPEVIDTSLKGLRSSSEDHKTRN